MSRLLEFTVKRTLLAHFQALRMSVSRFHRSFPELCVTGIPRSGTSYLCRILHDVKNCVVLNEPPEIMRLVETLEDLAKLPEFYQKVRTEIVAGKAISNKVVAGRMLEDTAGIPLAEQYNVYYPQVENSNFLLGVKNPLMFMARLPLLHRVMPHAVIVAVVRNPLDTIASWKNSFPHLSQVNLQSHPAGHSCDMLLPDWQRSGLRQIENTSILAVKRALYWAYLAEQLLLSRSDIQLFRYEELVADPAMHVHGILQAIPDAPPFELHHTLEASRVRMQRHLLDSEDRAAIRDICAATASELGYDLVCTE